MTGPRTVSAKTPFTLPTASRECPPSYLRIRLNKGAATVLVPGRPTSAVICRYYGWSDVRPHGLLAEARRIVRADVLRYLASELDALAPPTRRENCDEVMGGRADLFIFRYRAAPETRVAMLREACFPASNGRIIRNAIGAGHGKEVH